MKSVIAQPLPYHRSFWFLETTSSSYRVSIQLADWEAPSPCEFQCFSTSAHLVQQIQWVNTLLRFPTDSNIMVKYASGHLVHQLQWGNTIFHYKQHAINSILILLAISWDNPQILWCGFIHLINEICNCTTAALSPVILVPGNYFVFL